MSKAGTRLQNPESPQAPLNSSKSENADQGIKGHCPEEAEPWKRQKEEKNVRSSAIAWVLGQALR